MPHGTNDFSWPADGGMCEPSPNGRRKDAVSLSSRKNEKTEKNFIQNVITCLRNVF